MGKYLTTKAISDTPLQVGELALLLTLFETGRSLKDTLNLRIQDLGEQLQFTEYAVSISPQLHELLLKHLKTHPFAKRKDAFVFYSRESLQLSPRRVEQIMQAIGKKMGRKLNPRMIRHEGIVRQFLNGVPVEEIERRSGLASIERHLYKYHKEVRE